MEPVTHILTGACLARSGFNRRAAYATLTMAVAAEFPDIDTLWSLRGPVEGFTHHRGITHTFLGIPFEAAILVAAVYGLHRWRLARHQPSSTKPLTVAPVRWAELYGFALLALLSHLLLDFTNNYGLRPFFPFNAQWYAASIVFIFDPLIFALLLGALLAPPLFGLISAEVGAKRQPFRGRGWAIAALVGVVVLWMFRAVEHENAVELALSQSLLSPASAEIPLAPTVYLDAEDAMASPDPLSPFRWSTVTDFGPVYQRAEIDTRRGTVRVADSLEAKPDRSAAVLAAEASPLGRAYIDWSPMPFVDADRSGSKGDTVVSFRDPRFMGGWLQASGRSALSGSVTVSASGQVLRQSLDGRVER